MKYLVTGGCGFLGSNISKSLIDRGEKVFIIDNLFRKGSNDNLQWLRNQGDFKFFKEDIIQYDAIENIIQTVKPDIIYHLAGQVAMTTSIDNPLLDFQTNAVGTINVLESVRKHSEETAVIYSSTNKVYGDLASIKILEGEKRYYAPDYPTGFPENLPLEFHSPYGCSKGAADQYMLDYARIFGLKTVVFRHSSMYGSRQFATEHQGWIGWFVQNALLIKNSKLKAPIKISGNGKQVRDLLYVDDLVELYLKSGIEINKISGQAFNVGGGMENSYSILELFSYLEEKLDIQIKYIEGTKRISDQKVFVADNSKITSNLGWKSKISKNEGLTKMIDWVHKLGN